LNTIENSLTEQNFKGRLFSFKGRQFLYLIQMNGLNALDRFQVFDQDYRHMYELILLVPVIITGAFNNFNL